MLLGWTYLVNDEKISAIGQYIRTELTRRPTDVVGGDGVLGWESAHRQDQRRGSRKKLQLAVDLLAFCVSPAAALTVCWIHGHLTGLLITVSLVESAALVGLGIQMALYADLGRS